MWMYCDCTNCAMLRRPGGWDAAPSDQPKLAGGGKKRVLSYWCFNPGVAVRDFESHGTHSILLTSGTLSPLSSFATELSIALPVRLENPHVISPKQICVGVLRKGTWVARCVPWPPHALHPLLRWHHVAANVLCDAQRWVQSAVLHTGAAPGQVLIL
eukprot:m.1324022 g.1324022  ORF g.1324022 m.1324022 type:complete len:157 (+) comp24851_c0_seq34:195-665(+)